MSGSQIGVFIISENRLLRESLARILNKRPDLWAVPVQEINTHTLRSIEDSDPRVLLFDSVEPILSESEPLREFLTDPAGRRIVLIAMEENEDLFLETVRRGVTGYLLKDASATDVVSTVRSVHQGDVICPPCLCRILFHYVARKTAKMPVVRPRSRPSLTRREQQLVPLIAQGLTNKEIAAHFNLSEQTVKNHIHHILHKVGAEDRLGVLDAYRMQELEV